MVFNLAVKFIKLSCLVLLLAFALRATGIGYSILLGSMHLAHAASPGPKGSFVCNQGWTCLMPAGVAATDTAAIQAAVQTDYANVLLLPGTFVINSPIVITNRNVTVMGLTNTYPAGLGGSVPPYPASTNVNCSAISYTTYKVGCFTVKNQSAHFSGFHILGNGKFGASCIAAGDAGLLVDGNMELDNCYEGVVIDTSVGTTTGFALNPMVRNTVIPYAYEDAILCNSSCTDFIFGPDIVTEVAGTNYTGSGGFAGVGSGVMLGPNSLNGLVFGNFFDSGIGSPAVIFFENSLVSFRNNIIQQSVCAYSIGASTISFIENTCTGDSVGAAGIQFSTAAGLNNLNWLVANNYFPYGNSACYIVTSPATVSGKFSSNNCLLGGGNNLLLYNDLYTEQQIDPLVTDHPPGFFTLTLTGSTFSAPDWGNSFNNVGVLVHGTCPCTLPNPVYEATTYQAGTFAFVQSASGSETLSCGTKYKGCPSLGGMSANQIALVPWYGASSEVIFGTPVIYSP